MSGDGVQLVSVTHDFKFEAPDGKQRASEALHFSTILPDIETKNYNGWIYGGEHVEEAIVFLLASSGHGMKTEQIAREINERKPFEKRR